jgi:hypothetical protein
MGIANTFPVFEADQVLSNKHLNDLFNYLDQQDRLTRSKLIGSGIVCGLRISYSQQAIHVSKGAALTSQGYLALHCDSDYTHFVPYTVRGLPNDLSLIKQCGDAETGKIPFYKPGFESDLLQLITTDSFNGLEAGERANATVLSNVPGSDLDKYAVVLFLETEQVNLKNCDTNDCNDKGSRMDFDVKLLLVRKAVLDEIMKRQGGDLAVITEEDDSKDIQLKRYNVPVGTLNSSSDVLNAFTTLVDDAMLKKLAQLLSECYTNHRYLLENEDPFSNLFQVLSELREKIIATQPILIQYFYDFVDDLIKAYKELKEKLRGLRTECCGDEMRFPFHVMLGEANVNTAVGRSAYRQYFIYSSLFDPENERAGEVRMLFERLKLMVEQVSFGDIGGFEKRTVKITPSRQGVASLSKRCIPYYYKVATVNKELYRSWDYRKSSRRRAKFNLSYNSPDYATADPVVNPLLYDIEPYDFFRVEGHIGKSVNDAMIRVKQLQQKFNLPFETIALSADYIGALVKGEEPKCLIQDLESDYRVLIAEFVCRVHDAMCMASKVKYTGRPTMFPQVVSTPISNPIIAAGLRLIANPRAINVDTTPATNPDRAAVAIADDDDEDKLVINAINRLPDAVDHVFVSTLVNEFHSVKKYIKGDTLARLCNPPKGLVGNKYISIVKSNNGEFRNPVAFKGMTPISGLHFHLFEFIDRIESVIRLVMLNELADLNVADFKNAFKRLETAVKNLKNVSPRIAAEVEMTFDSCIVERLEALKNEYLRRTAEYRLARNFNYYFKKHGGIEHKAGVPRGGTFILVYHEQRRQKFVDVRSLFINKELSALMMSHFQGMLKPAVKLNHLEFQSKLLQTATLYKEPELFIRMKDVMQKYLDECQDLPEDRRKEIINIINRPPEQPRFQLTHQMVIADFYVPYLCCSDCPPVTYILPPPPKDESADPTIKIDKNSFCNDDRTVFGIDVTPAGGEITGEGVRMENGRFVFSPFGLAGGSYNITYKANDKTVSVLVTVTATPVPKFKGVINKIGDDFISIRFNNLTVDAGMPDIKYKWSLDGDVFSEDKNPVKEFPKDKFPLGIVLQASNGACPGETKDVIQLPRTDERELTVCSNVKRLKLEETIPPGSSIEITQNDGDIANDDLVIRPSAMNVTETKVFTVAYTINGNQVTVAITVIFNNANFTMQLSRGNLGTNLPPVMLVLKPKATGLAESKWTLKQGGRTEHPIDGQPFPLRDFNPDQAILITHTAVTVVNNVSCGGDKTFELTPRIAGLKLNREEFDNDFRL